MVQSQDKILEDIYYGKWYEIFVLLEKGVDITKIFEGTTDKLRNYFLSRIEFDLIHNDFKNATKGLQLYTKIFFLQEDYNLLQTLLKQVLILKIEQWLRKPAFHMKRIKNFITTIEPYLSSWAHILRTEYEQERERFNKTILALYEQGKLEHTTDAIELYEKIFGNWEPKDLSIAVLVKGLYASIIKHRPYSVIYDYLDLLQRYATNESTWLLQLSTLINQHAQSLLQQQEYERFVKYVNILHRVQLYHLLHSNQELKEQMRNVILHALDNRINFIRTIGVTQIKRTKRTKRTKKTRRKKETKRETKGIEELLATYQLLYKNVRNDYKIREKLFEYILRTIIEPGSYQNTLALYQTHYGDLTSEQLQQIKIAVQDIIEKLLQEHRITVAIAFIENYSEFFGMNDLNNLYVFLQWAVKYKLHSSHLTKMHIPSILKTLLSQKNVDKSQLIQIYRIINKYFPDCCKYFQHRLQQLIAKQQKLLMQQNNDNLSL